MPGAGGEHALRRDELRHAAEQADRLSELHAAGLQRLASPRSFFSDGLDLHALIAALLAGTAEPSRMIEEAEASHMEKPFIEEVPRPYFESLHRELTAAFDARLFGGAIHDTHWEVNGDVETEVVVHDASGRVIRRRITRRKIGERPGGPGSPGA